MDHGAAAVHLVRVQLVVHVDAKDHYPFETPPERLAEIELEDDVLPEGVPVFLIEKDVKVKGKTWRIHKNDADPFPSNPHAHNYDARVKLHLGTGDLYEKLTT